MSKLCKDSLFLNNLIKLYKNILFLIKPAMFGLITSALCWIGKLYSKDFLQGGEAFFSSLTVFDMWKLGIITIVLGIFVRALNSVNDKFPIFSKKKGFFFFKKKFWLYMSRHIISGLGSYKVLGHLFVLFVVIPLYKLKHSSTPWDYSNLKSIWDILSSEVWGLAPYPYLALLLLVITISKDFCLIIYKRNKKNKKK